MELCTLGAIERKFRTGSEREHVFITPHTHAHTRIAAQCSPPLQGKQGTLNYDPLRIPGITENSAPIYQVAIS